MGDQILEINGYKTESMTHSDAIDIIQNGGQTVRLLVRRTGKLPPAFGKFILKICLPLNSLLTGGIISTRNNVENLDGKNYEVKI